MSAPFEARGGLPGLLRALADLHARDEVGVLGLVYETAGSTYQKPGALVLLGSQGMIHGAISGGCLEPELEERARAVQRSGLAQTIEFDTRSDEDLIFGSGTGCRGRIHLLLLPQARGAPFTRALNRLVAVGGALDVGISIESPDPGSGQAVLNGTPWFWGPDGRMGLFQECAATVALKIAAPPRVLLFGAGPETLTLNLFTARVGWLLQVLEHRGRWLKFAQAAGVDQVIELPPDEAEEVWREQPVSAAIAMTHNYALDMQHLALCARSDLSYIGLLGPASRRDAMLTDLGPDLASRLNGRLRAPVGLDLGGRGPEPLALAIVAELQQHFANETRRFAKHGLRETTLNPSPNQP
jgi:xanthine dehydrogenase accessory factor